MDKKLIWIQLSSGVFLSKKAIHFSKCLDAVIQIKTEYNHLQTSCLPTSGPESIRQYHLYDMSFTKWWPVNSYSMPFQYAPFVPNHDITCCQWTCLFVQRSKQTLLSISQLSHCFFAHVVFAQLVFNLLLASNSELKYGYWGCITYNGMQIKHLYLVLYHKLFHDIKIFLDTKKWEKTHRKKNPKCLDIQIQNIPEWHKKLKWNIVSGKNTVLFKAANTCWSEHILDMSLKMTFIAQKGFLHT